MADDLVERLRDDNSEWIYTERHKAADMIETLTIALHDAIRRPMGVVPESAERFYNPALETGEWKK